MLVKSTYAFMSTLPWHIAQQPTCQYVHNSKWFFHAMFNDIRVYL